MKKIIIKIVIATVVAVALFVYWFSGRNIKVLEDIDISSVDKVIIYNAGFITLVEQEDMKAVIEILQSMELDRARGNWGDGRSFAVDICYKDGSENRIVFLEENVCVDDEFYSCDRNYCDDLRAMFKKFAQEYPIED